MKIKSLLYFIILIIPHFIISQSLVTKKDSIKNTNLLNITMGIGQTFLFNNPVLFRRAYEGVKDVVQKPLFSPDFQVVFNKRIMNNFIRIGSNFSMKRIQEKGKSWSIFTPDNYENYERIESNMYVGVLFGWRINNLFTKSIFFDNDIIIERKIDNKNNYFLSKFGAREKIKMGYEYNILKNINLEVCTFFSFAIIKYNTMKINKNYYPLSYGIEIGLSKKYF